MDPSKDQGFENRLTEKGGRGDPRKDGSGDMSRESCPEAYGRQEGRERPLLQNRRGGRSDSKSLRVRSEESLGKTRDSRRWHIRAQLPDWGSHDSCTEWGHSGGVESPGEMEEQGIPRLSENCRRRSGSCSRAPDKSCEDRKERTAQQDWDSGVIYVMIHSCLMIFCEMAILMLYGAGCA